MSDSVRPHRWQPTRLPRPWDSPGKNTGVGCHGLLQCMKGNMKGKSLSRVRLFPTPWTAAYQAPPPMGFSRQRVLKWVAIAFSVLISKLCISSPMARNSSSMKYKPFICSWCALLKEKLVTIDLTQFGVDVSWLKRW